MSTAAMKKPYSRRFPIGYSRVEKCVDLLIARRGYYLAPLLQGSTPSHADVLHRRFQLVHLHLSRATLFPLEVRAPAPGGVNDSNDSIRGCS